MKRLPMRLPLFAGVAAFLLLLLAVPAGRSWIRGLVYRTHAFGGRPLTKGQCTWYAQQRAADFGWRICFDADYDRHARNWRRKVVNARCVADPQPGAIMVLDAWDGNPYGHVAVVESVRDADHWTICHANFAAGTIIGWREWVPIYRADCERTAEGVLLAGRDAPFRLIGFLAR